MFINISSISYVKIQKKKIKKGVHIITSKVKSYRNQLWIKTLKRDGHNFVSFQILLLIFTMLNSDISNDQKKIGVVC